MIGERLVKRWGSELDDLKARGALQNAVADSRRLQNTVSGLENKRRPLVLIGDAAPIRAGKR